MKKPSLDRFELCFFLGGNGIPTGDILRFPLDVLGFQHRRETWCQRRSVAVRFRVEAEGERLEVFRILQICFFPKQRGIRFTQPAFRFENPAFEQSWIDRAFVNVEERDVVESDLVQQDDEFDEVSVGLLPERLFPSPEEIIEQGRNAVGKGIRIEIIV